MDPTDIAFIKAVAIGVFAVGTALTAYWLSLRGRTRRAPGLEIELDELHAEQVRQRAAVESRLAELEQRLDRTERRLASERSGSRRLEPHTPTPV